MRRRALLTVLGTGLLAGCSSSGSGGGTETPEPVATHETADWRINFSQWYAVESIPYYDSEQESVEQLQPERDWWLETSISVTYLPEGSAEAPEPEQFAARTGGGKREPMTSVPDVDWENIRLESPHRTYWIEPGGVGDQEVEGGEDELLYLLFDVEDTDMPLIVFEGADGPVTLKPDIGILPNGEGVRH